MLPAETGNKPVEDDLFDQKDVKVEVMRSRGAGGQVRFLPFLCRQPQCGSLTPFPRPGHLRQQHVNKTESAIRLTHLPTGITVSMQDSRSQHENRDKAYRVLRSRLLDRRLTAEMEERRDVRRNQVKGTDRSEKIRTYNFKDVSRLLACCHAGVLIAGWR